MRFFALLLDFEGRGISNDVLQSYESIPRCRGLEFAWQSLRQATVLTACDDPYGDPLVVKEDGHLAVGSVRLDNRAELERWADCKDEQLSDLGLVLRVVARHGTKHIPQILGDFGFVVWDSMSRTALAACDAFSVRKLYYATDGGMIAFASRAELLARKEVYDLQCLSELLAYCPPSSGRTIYSGVHAIPAATLARAEHGNIALTQYWSASEHLWESTSRPHLEEYAHTVRGLLLNSIKLRLADRPNVWAHLSGGLDSSSVVSGAQWLASRAAVPYGLNGTITCVDTHGAGADERSYSDEVLKKYQVRNEVVLDYPCWREDNARTPLLDQPSGGFPFYARERRTCEIITAAGGKVLLTGIGGDNLFAGNMLFFSDWLVRGRVVDLVREMARRAAVGRVSFWELAFKNALLPLLPSQFQALLASAQGGPPPWISSDVIRRYNLRSRSPAGRTYAGGIGRKYGDALVEDVNLLPEILATGVAEEMLEVRHPFLYRPLVEFALSIPPEMCAQPHARKWVLRKAMVGILPDKIRTRVGKGTTYGQLAWSLSAYRARFAAMLKDPLLAQLGCIDPVKLRGAFSAAQEQRENRDQVFADVQYTLAFEAWLQARSGRQLGNHQVK